MIELADVRAAAERIAGRVRPTPLLAALPMQTRLGNGCALVLKLECLQVTGSFKARGAISKLTSLPAGRDRPRSGHRFGRQSRRRGRLCRLGRGPAGDGLRAGQRRAL